MAKARFTAKISFVIEYDEKEFEDKDEAAYYFLQESDYEFKYPDPTKIRAIKTEIYENSEAENVAAD